MGEGWFRARSSVDGLVTRNEGEDVMIALKPDPQNLTERDLLEVKKASEERGSPAIEFRLTPDGAQVRRTDAGALARGGRHVQISVWR